MILTALISFDVSSFSTKHFHTWFISTRCIWHFSRSAYRLETCNSSVSSEKKNITGASLRNLRVMSSDQWWNDDLPHRDWSLFLHFVVDQRSFSESFDTVVDRFFSFQHPIFSYYPPKLYSSVFPKNQQKQWPMFDSLVLMLPDPMQVSIQHSAAYQPRQDHDSNHA